MIPPFLWRVDSLDGTFPWLVAVSISLLADPPDITSSG
jgi:hypothetical protein